jgi:microbial collagenase
MGAGVDFGTWYGIQYGYGGDPTRSPFYGQVGGYVGELGRLVLFGQLEAEYEWLLENAGYWLRQLPRLAPGPALNQILTQVIADYGRWTRPSLQAVQGIVEHYGGVDADGQTYQLEEVRQELHDQLLPRRHTFDDGATVFETGPHVDPVKVRRLYWAMKEVKAQFHREIGRDAVLEPGRADDRLTAVIFDSPADYAYNQFLNGQPTDNGGIYIEASGTLFTYERTPAESVYSLEELLRHEYSHYLQGRFLIFGPWGGPIYQEERLTWFEEGQAELLAGSTRAQGIRLRRSLARLIADDGPSAWMHLADAVHARYDGGFKFYRYAMAVFAYLRESHPELRSQLVERLLARDGAGFDLLIGTMSADAGLEAGYRQYLQAVAAAAPGAVDPFTADEYVYDPLADRDLEAIVRDVTAALPLQDASATVLESSDMPAVVIEGTVTGSPSAGASEDARRMEARVQQAQHALEALGWPGYRTFTGHFVDHRLMGTDYQYRMVVTGKLGSALACSSTLSEPSATLVAGGGPAAVGVTADNGCVWSAVSTVPWLAVTEGALGAGGGSVGYEAGPNVGASRTGSLAVAGRTLAVTQQAVPEGLTETEPDASRSTANGPVVSGTRVTGTLPSVQNDYYYFDVTAPGPVRIVLIPDAPGSTWVVEHESAPGEWVAGGIEQPDGQIVGGFTARLTGRYYLIAYRWGGTVTSYRFVATYPAASDCRYAIAPGSASVPPGGGSLGVSVTEVRNGCRGWTARSQTPWIVVTAGASGSGSGTVQITVSANRVAARTGTLTIDGQTLTITQPAPAPAASRPRQRLSTRQWISAMAESSGL